VLAQASKGVLVAAPHMYVTIPTRSIVQRNIIEPFGPGREEKKSKVGVHLVGKIH
jgi:hypothetical protein